MAEHTPGPWEWECCDYSMAILHGPDLFVDHVLSVSPCEPCQARADTKEWVWGRCTTPNLANASLIAAAPDLLAALVEIANNECSPDAADLGLSAVRDIARAAIAKIEGRA